MKFRDNWPQTNSNEGFDLAEFLLLTMKCMGLVFCLHQKYTKNAIVLNIYEAGYRAERERVLFNDLS